MLREVAESDFEQLYWRYRRYVYSLALRALRSHADAEEILQEVFLDLWLRPPDLRESAVQLFTWLALLTKTRSRRRIRYNKSRPACVELTVDPESGIDLPKEVEEAALRSRFETVLQRASFQHRQVLSLTYFEGQGPTEIARCLGIPVITVRKRLESAIRCTRRAVLRPERLTNACVIARS
jgi:RNA polymerase sigma-70 factor (ECF subfamily)